MRRYPLVHWLERASYIGAFTLVYSAAALAQLGSSPGPSPLMPGDLKTPIFDTRTPVYDVADEQAKSAKTVVAEVDGRPITLGDVADAIAELPAPVRAIPFADLFPEILDQLVRQQALAIRAQHQGLDEDPAVRRKIKAVSDRVLGDELLRRETSRSITEAALLARYNKDTADKPGPEEVHVRVIMVPTEQEALAIIGDLRANTDFAALAKRSSKDPSAPAGGDVGFVTLDQLNPEIGSVVFAMQPNQFTPFPVSSMGSWFVLKVEERRRHAVRGFTAEHDELRQTMMREAAPDVMKAAMTDVSIRAYDINGKEFHTAAPKEAAKTPK